MPKKTQKAKVKDLDPQTAAKKKVKGGSTPSDPHDQSKYRPLQPVRDLTPDISPPR